MSAPNSWLTSIHAAYHLPKRGMCAATDFLSPTGILVTSDESKAGVLDSIVEEMSYHFRRVEVQSARKGCLQRTTEWREHLLHQLRTVPHDLTERYLKNPVEWDPRRNPVGKDAVRAAGTLQ